METDIGNPIDYNPTISPLEGQEKDEDIKPQEEQYYYHLFLQSIAVRA